MAKANAKFDVNSLVVEEYAEPVKNVKGKKVGEGRKLTPMQENVLSIAVALKEAGVNKQIKVNAADIGSDAEWNAGVTYSCNRVLQAFGRITGDGLVAHSTGGGKNGGVITTTIRNYGEYDKEQYLSGADTFQGPNETLVRNVGVWLCKNTDAEDEVIAPEVGRVVEELRAEEVARAAAAE